MVIECFFETFTNSDWISLINIFITSCIGVWIGVVVQKNLTTNRALKEYFVSEINGINLSYTSFMKLLYTNKLSSKGVQEWFKIMNIRIEIAEESIKSQLNIKPTILSNHVKLKQYVTNLEEFNNCYKKEKLMLLLTSRNEILEMNRGIKNSIVKIVVDINKADKKRSWYLRCWKVI